MNYEKAWGMLKRDLKDIAEYNSKMKRDSNDKFAVTEDLSKRLIAQMNVYEKQIGKKPDKLVDYELKGWSYEELAEIFNLRCYLPEEVTENSLYTADDILAHNVVLHFLENNFFNEKVINTVRNYMKKMIEEPMSGEYAKVWNAMLEIEDNFVFMQFVIAFLQHMWT